MGCQSHLRPAGTTLLRIISIFLGTTVVQITRVFCCCYLFILGQGLVKADHRTVDRLSLEKSRHVSLWCRWKGSADLCFIPGSAASQVTSNCPLHYFSPKFPCYEKHN